MKKILIVEDNQSIAELQRDYLEIAGFESVIAMTGTDGVAFSRQQSFDLILLDIMLPGMDGFQVCRIIREEQDIPILMVSARKEDIDKIRGLGLGADDYIVKPFSPNELVARVQAHLARYERLISHEKPKTMLTIRQLQIDKDARRVFIAHEELFFTTKEFDLLYFLATHPDHVFSKEELFERIWGLEAFGDNTTITVHIRKIREKMEPIPSQPQFIETVWGAGYRFRAY
ncbi:MAG: response regulator transcription factor [Candidatus Kurthia intestinigallinarum]